MVEDSRLKGNISGSLNATFLVLIPKDKLPLSFNDYRPISLCNLVYKLISKVISNLIKHFLGRSLSTEQLGFLKVRRIQDDIGAAHECIHSIKQQNIKALIMKLDLKRAFDSIDWDFLRLVLHAVGFGEKLSNWILACVTSANFMEGLSLLLTKSFNELKISGIKVSKFMKIVHLMFVDDVLLLSNAVLVEWSVIQDVLPCFCFALGLSIILSKSSVYY